jgi:DNA topoisomerase-1
MLRHVTDERAGITRTRRGKYFSYADARGAAVRDAATRARIRALAIPPAWTHVWISPDPEGHIQATGRDARGRKQYRYHARWRELRDAAKYHHLVEFCRVLPRVRATVERDLRAPRLPRRKVIAAVVALVERAQLRVGNDAYTRANGSYGATTLRDRHVAIHGATLELAYRGKSGVPRHVRITDRRLARIIARCRALPGPRLFQCIDDAGRRHAITAADINAYLRDATGGHFTAKDYRTWAATLGAALLLCATEHPGTARGCKQCIGAAIAAVAERLGHTPTVCRASYIHPRVLADFSANRLARTLGRALRAYTLHLALTPDAIGVDVLRAIEPHVARYLER